MKNSPPFPRAFAPLLIALAWLAPHPAAAWWGKKIDPAQLEGKYDSIATSDTSAGCPATITVTYDPGSHALDSEIFHFANIDQGSQPVDAGGILTDPRSAAYSEAWMTTKLTSDSVVEKRYDHAVSADTSRLPIFPEPLDPTPTMGLAESTRVQTTAVKLDAKLGLLKKTADIDGSGTGENCEYKKEL